MTRLEGVVKRLQDLEDIEAIKNLKARYGQACDDQYNPILHSEQYC